MAEQELVRLEIGFHGGDVLAARVPVQDADALDQRLRSGEDGIVELQGEDARLLVALAKVQYVKRYARESRVGFSSR